ncbi:MAG: hypothetical protein ACE5JR_00705 [Gemmatimonadota bacterium]
MSEHLTLEQISALLDEPDAGARRLSHLEGCDACRREYEQMSRMRMAISAFGELEPPAGQWERILERLPVPAEGEADGERVSEIPARPDIQPWWQRARWPLQAAAILVLLAGGLVVVLRMGVAPGTEEGDLSRIAETAPVGRPVAETGEPLAERGPAFLGDPEAAYLQTVADLAELRSPEPGGRDIRRDPEAAAEQLARLDAVRDALRDALQRSPADPVLNNLLFEVMDERDVLARQLVETLRLTDLEYR